MYVVPEMLDMQRVSGVRQTICVGHLEGHSMLLCDEKVELNRNFGNQALNMHGWGCLHIFHGSRPWWETHSCSWRPWWPNEIEPDPPLRSENYCYPLCNLQLAVWTSLQLYQAHGLCVSRILHVKLKVWPWLTSRSKHLISCDSKHIQYFDF